MILYVPCKLPVAVEESIAEAAPPAVEITVVSAPLIKEHVIEEKKVLVVTKKALATTTPIV